MGTPAHVGVSGLPASQMTPCVPSPIASWNVTVPAGITAACDGLQVRVRYTPDSSIAFTVGLAAELTIAGMTATAAPRTATRGR